MTTETKLPAENGFSLENGGFWLKHAPEKPGWYWMRSSRHACPVPKWVTPSNWRQAFEDWERFVHLIPNPEQLEGLIQAALMRIGPAVIVNVKNEA